MRPSRGKASVYLLFLIVGIVLGAIAGAEIIRWVYRTTAASSTAPSSAAQNHTSPASPAPPPLPPETSPRGNIELSRKNAIVRATQTVSPCVVGIVVTQIQMVRTPYYFGDFLDLFFAPELAPRYKEVENMGSGFIIDEDGLIITNFHVVQGAQKLYVNLPNGNEVEGKIVGVDSLTDLALIKIERSKCPTVKLGHSTDLMIGEWAIAIGNPFGFFIKDSHPTVTVGVISALDRNFSPSQGDRVFYQGMIQTDAAINPGNSGGPLVNALGEVIGINTFIYTGSSNNRGSIGIGFAIPIDRAKRVVQELRTYGHRRKVCTGVSVQQLNRAIALQLGYNNLDGVVVTGVRQGSPGEKAGLKAGDIIVGMGKRYIRAPEDIEGFFLDYFVGDVVRIRYVRSGKNKSTNLILAECGPRG